jgi:serine/threonine protein kinase/Tfp pilus assembly protein PilF
MDILPPGTRIEQYEIVSPPMMGGMGVVYFALDHGNDSRPVALKTFRPELLPDRAARDRFLREGNAWVELGNHPHIVRCFRVKYIDPAAFLVLELITKEQNMSDASLRSWLIPGQQLPLEQALSFALQIARGMQHAIEKISGFVHRDLKPENILVGAEKLLGTNINRLCVTDFGLVKAINLSNPASLISEAEEFKPNHIQFTRGIGTPLYMAPEQWKGEAVGEYTDIYAFGCIFYEMLTGNWAANGKKISELQASHCNGTLRPIPSNLPKELVVLIRKCLSLNPAHRYQTWIGLTDSLENAYEANLGTLVPQKIKSEDQNYDGRQQAGWSYNAIGMAYRDIGKADAALGYFEKALLTAREIGDQFGEANALDSLGTAYAQLGDLQRAINCYELSLSISREISDRRVEQVALGNLGLAYRHLGNAQQAINYFEQVLEILHDNGDRTVEGQVLGNLGNAYADLGNIRQAIVYYEKDLAIARELGNLRGQSITLTNIGNRYADLGDMPQAIGYFEQSLADAREIGDRRAEGTIRLNLGRAYATLRHMQRAITYFEQSLAIAREVGDRGAESIALTNLGTALGDEPGAISYYEQALEILREIGDRRGEGQVLGNMAQTYVDLGDAPQAHVYFEQALRIHREVGNLEGVARYSFIMAPFYAQQGDTARAMHLAREAAQIWVQIGSPHANGAERLVVQLQGEQDGALPLADAQRTQQLLERMQRANFTPTQPKPAETAFESFQQATSLEDIRVAVAKYPFMVEDQFMNGIEKLIEEEISPNLERAFERRLVWLQQVAGKQRPGFLKRFFGKKDQ